MSVTIELHNASGERRLPLRRLFRLWTEAALAGAGKAGQYGNLSIRIVDADESASLNRQYRHKNYATNVLSFPVPQELHATGQLGDLAMCATVVKQEALEQNKTLVNHWAHLVVHGVLHLLGYDHEHNKDAKKMENLEVKILASLGIPDPYQP